MSIGFACIGILSIMKYIFQHKHKDKWERSMNSCIYLLESEAIFHFRMCIYSQGHVDEFYILPKCY